MHSLSDHKDITQSVNLTDPQEVCTEICRILRAANRAMNMPLIERAFDVFAKLYAGTLPGYHGCETLYHDMQHALDVTLAAARMMAGFEKAHADGQRLGSERLSLGMVVALFHDAGYIRRRKDRTHTHGAQYTLVHVARGSRFLTHFLKEEGYGEWALRASKLIHFTGYEIPIKAIRLKDKLDWQLGCLIGTADLIAQMADRVYLEKCRDYLFEEFEMGGLTRRVTAEGVMQIVYESAYDLLRKTPAFYVQSVKKRLDNDLQASYQYIDALMGSNPYMAAIERNMQYLDRLVNDGKLTEMLRRRAEAVLAPVSNKR